jgi:hypothetical protein
MDASQTESAGVWAVDFAAEPHVVDALERCAGVVGAHQIAFTGAPWDPVEKTYMSTVECITLFVDAPSDAVVARERALALLSQICREADIDTNDVSVVAFYEVYPAGGRADRALQLARELQAEGRHSLAVVSAQTGVEVFLRQSMSHVVEGLGTEMALVLEFARGFSLMDPVSQRLFTFVFGRRPTSYPWWHEYAAHVARRNEIVHRGADVTSVEAATSIAVAEQIVATIRHDALGLDLFPEAKKQGGKSAVTRAGPPRV